ncbi:Flagella basal body P-ring formation protein FlgA [Burkholderiaceae bacterium]|nr:Flagella basal body P-ring formation protein FlgA [Burkholderiaceae bacterium]
MEISGFLSVAFARIAAALMLAAAPAFAWGDVAPALDAAVEDQVKQLALAASRQAGAEARIDIEVGQLDRRLRLAPCRRIEPYLPPGTRLWGKARIGLRCSDGPSRWNVYLPITVRVYGRALVAKAPLGVGSVLGPGDLVQAEVDLAEEASMAVMDAEFAVGRTMARAVNAGQSLREAHLKTRQWFAAGEMVKVLAVGAGFSVAGEGRALTPGWEGQPARVRTESGRVLTGMPSGERRIELAL